MATMKTLNGYGFNATELNGKTSDSYLLKTDTVANSADSQKLGGKAPEYYIQPRNLLDNSDFRNLVNQRGITSETSVSAYSYFIDRWVNQTNEARSFTLSTSGIGLSLATTLLQRIEKIEAGKIVTFAIKLSDGTIATLTGTVQYTSDDSWTRFASKTHSFGDLYLETMYGFVNVVVYTTKTITIEWVALYEGSYTADTLPPYVPKGYAAELAECLRYFERLGSTFSEQIGNIVYVVSGAKSFVCSLQCSRKRIPHPSVSISGVDNYRLLLKDATNASVYNAASISSFDSITVQEPFISFRTNVVNAITQNSWIQLQRADGATAAYIDVSADL